jgi:hypothetical protein
MLARLRSHLTFANVTSALALFVALATGGAYASHLVVNGSDVVDESLSGADVRGRAGTSTAAAANGSLTTHDIAGQQPNAANGTPFIDGTLSQWDVRNGSLVGGDLADNTVRGADVDESSLGQVPSALLGGFGRSGAMTQCNPESEAFVFCAGTEILDVPAGARALVLGRASAKVDGDANVGSGDCRLSTSSIGAIPNSEMHFFVAQSTDLFQLGTLVGVTPPLPAGATSFGIECNSPNDPTFGIGLEYDDISASVVLISDD